MKKSSETGVFILREAIEEDIPHLSMHHRKMFEEIWEKKGKAVSDSVSIEVGKAYSQKLSLELGDFCRCWVIEMGGKVVASGGVTIVSFVPTPDDWSSKVGYLHSMYTDELYRGKSFANLIVKAAIQYCQDNGIKRVVLNASDAGKPIYEKIGFLPSPETMKIFTA